MNGKSSDKNFMQRGKDRLRKEQSQDPYTSHNRFREPTVCTGCDAVYLAGRWQWLPARLQATNEDLCPACCRIRDKIPAGSLNLSGDFFEQYRDEILSLVFHLVAYQKAEFPMKRIMDIEDTDGGGVEINFTDTHLPHSVGETIKHAYKGKLDIQAPDAADSVRASWVRQQ
jgi:hypothetical protein